MTERDKKDAEVVERWNASQAARAMAAGCEDDHSWESPSSHPAVESAGVGRRSLWPRFAAGLVFTVGIAAVFTARNAVFPWASRPIASASPAGPLPPAAGEAAPRSPIDAPGERSPVVEWRVDQGGNGHRYQLVSLGRNLKATDGAPLQGLIGVAGAVRIAHESGADLATIRSQAEHDFIHAFVAAHYPRYRSFRVLIGGVRTQTGHAWRNGEPFDFDLMSPIHPVNPVGSPIVIGGDPESPWCPDRSTGCWMTFPAEHTWAFHVAVLEWATSCADD